VDDLVEQRRHVEERETLEDRQGHPEEGIGQVPQPVAAKADDRELPPGIEEMAPRVPLVERPQLLEGDGITQLLLEGSDLFPVMA
jgi:hypothetical protein